MRMIAFAQIASFRFDKRSSSFQIESEKSNSRLEKSPFWKFWSTDLGSNGPDTNTETYIIGSVTRSKKVAKIFPIVATQFLLEK